MATLVKARQIEPGSNGDVLTTVGGVPVWGAVSNAGQIVSMKGFASGGAATFPALYDSVTGYGSFTAARTNMIGGIMDQLNIDVLANTATTAVDIFFHVNGSDTALTVNIPAGATGQFSDVVNSVAVVDGDFASFRTTGAAVGTVNYSIRSRFTVT